MTEGVTSNGISYEWYVTGLSGRRFILYPEQENHTEEQVESARLEIKSKSDVLSLQIRWKKKDDKTPSPDKIPDYLIIKGLQQKVGGLESHILELEDTHKKDLQEEKREIRKSIQAEEIYTQIKKENAKIKKENLNLKQTISDLIAKQHHKKD